MKVPGRDVERFVAAPPAAVKAVLLFGENAGLSREIAERLARRIVPDLGSKDRLVELTGDQLRKDPARLLDEASQISMFAPGPKVVWVKDATDSVSETIVSALDTGVGDSFIIIESGELTARSALRTALEGHNKAAVIANYEDTPETLVGLADDIVRALRITAAKDVLSSIVASTGSDRRILRKELEKLEVFFGTQDASPRELTASLATELFGNSGSVEANDVVAALGLGDVVGVATLLEKAEETGGQPGQIVSTALRTLHALLAASATGSGDDPLTVARSRGLWGQPDTVIRAMLRCWAKDKLLVATRLLAQAEADTRTTGLPEWPIAARALLHATRLAN
ncbi:MAG TPA: hypothetical protein DCL54_09605 [Alphaproteobacteria bacterium]|nr:hypothetical protein [Alphaproteobacteria bacterium]